MTAFPLGIYVGNPNGNDVAANATFLNAFNSFEALMGAPPLFMDAFVDFGQDPSLWDSNASWTAWSWAKTGSAYVGPGSGVTPVIGVPLASNAGGWGSADAFFKLIIAGTLDATYQGIVSSWAGQGYTTIQLRLGYEFDGNFMPWGPGNSSSPTVNSDFVAAWQHVADLVHQQGVASGITVQTVWNPADINWASVSPASLYPGDLYVDVISTDAYSPVYPLDLTNWSDGTTAQVANVATWAADAVNRAHYWQYSDATQYALTGNGHGWSFQDTVNLAATHNKPLSISETGAGNNGSTTGPADDPAFPQWLARALAQAEARGVVVKNVNIWATDQGDGSWGFLNGENPLEAAAWANYFGAGSTVTSPTSLPVPVPTTVAPDLQSTLLAITTPAGTAIPAPLGTSPAQAVTIVQSQSTAVDAVHTSSFSAWQQASPVNPIDTIIGQTVYSVIGVQSDGNIGVVLVTSTPIAISDNQWGQAVSVVVSPFHAASSPSTASAVPISPAVTEVPVATVVPVVTMLPAVTLMPVVPVVPAGPQITVTQNGVTTLFASGSTVTTKAGKSIVYMGTAGGTVDTAGSDTVFGGTVASTVNIGTSATVVGGASLITVNGGIGPSTVIAGAGGLTYNGATGVDTVAALISPSTINGGSGGGLFAAGAGSTINAGGGLSVEFGGNGAVMNAIGSTGVLFATTGGDATMNSSKDTGTSVFFAASSSGNLTFITGAGTDLLAMGSGTNNVTLGSGSATVFANAGAIATTITAGTGSAYIAFAGTTTTLDLAASTAHTTRNEYLFGFTQGTDHLALTGFSAAQTEATLASAKIVGGGTILTLADGTALWFVGNNHVTAAAFT